MMGNGKQRKEEKHGDHEGYPDRRDARVRQGIAYVLMQSGMHCVGCPSSVGESLEEACAVHGLDVEAVLANIKEYQESVQ